MIFHRGSVLDQLPDTTPTTVAHDLPRPVVRMAHRRVHRDEGAEQPSRTARACCAP
jgi:hypothetical protein